MKSLLVRLGVILIIGLMMIGYAEAWGEDWKLGYSDSRTGQYYYDAENIIYPSPDVIRVWVKGIVTDEIINAAAKDIGEKYRDLSYLIFLTEINCKDKIMGDLKTTFYSKQGVAMISLPSTGDRYPISPGSMGEALYKAVCK